MKIFYRLLHTRNLNLPTQWDAYGYDIKKVSIAKDLLAHHRDHAVKRFETSNLIPIYPNKQN